MLFRSAIPRGLRALDESALRGDAAGLDESAPIDVWDIQSIIYTSGTTGSSKGVLSPYLQLYTTAMVNYGYMGEGECILVNLPMFHVGGTSPTYTALVRGVPELLRGHVERLQFGGREAIPDDFGRGFCGQGGVSNSEDERSVGRRRAGPQPELRACLHGARVTPERGANRSG